MIQFWEISLSSPTDLSTLMSEPADRPGLTGEDTTYFRELVLSVQANVGNRGSSLWFQFFLSVGVTTHPSNTFSFSLARRASSKECLSGFCYPCIFKAKHDGYCCS